MMTTYSPNTHATIAAIRKYDDMCLINKNTPDEIKCRYDSIGSPCSPKLDGMPRNENFHAGEERWVDGLDMLAQIKKRYDSAVSFLKWFEPMWTALSDAERLILETYKHTDIRSGMPCDTIEFYYSTRQLNRTRKKALERLEFLLFGE